ncbi:MAG: COX15/CtaA family protein, partial [Rhodospirillales bacterium]|nr:COX15/CtaA family protein [Rhodospirillales bacterium]
MQLLSKQDGRAAAALDRNARVLSIWLFTVAAMVFIMVILGGLTRLTGSGLSMVDWRPISGWLPPLNEHDWRAVFDLYRQIPQYSEINSGMTVDEFKSIFWLEYTHRLWGRVIGLAFALPFLYFAFRRMFDWRLGRQLLVMFALGALQGILGWFMVKSGLTERTDVSQYRLASHLSAAVLIYAYILWVALGLYNGRRRWSRPAGRGGFAFYTAFVVIWLAVTMFWGGLVAGLDAGLTYNTFPLMDGRFIPDGLLLEEPVIINFFENIAAVQFTHRLLAEGALILIFALWLWARRLPLGSRAHIAFTFLSLMAAVQFILGLATLILVVPIPLAVAHQAGAFILLAFALWA